MICGKSAENSSRQYSFCAAMMAVSSTLSDSLDDMNTHLWLRTDEKRERALFCAGHHFLYKGRIFIAVITDATGLIGQARPSLRGSRRGG